jgi:D-lyxose ketol-isomerase
MRISCDEALKRFSELAENDWPKLTEADTRSKIIDPVFTQCLNWQETDFVREEHDSSGYVDYLFKIRNRNSFVVEAKKTENLSTFL